MMARLRACVGGRAACRFAQAHEVDRAQAQTEQYLLRRNGGGGGGGGGAQRRHKTFAEELICVSSATLLSSAAITAAECPAGRRAAAVKVALKTPAAHYLKGGSGPVSLTAD